MRQPIWAGSKRIDVMDAVIVLLVFGASFAAGYGLIDIISGRLREYRS
jgi:hypothetical protein